MLLLFWVIFYSRLHGRYHELAPHLVPMDYTNDPDCKLPLALIVNMPELKVKKNLLLNDPKHEAMCCSCKVLPRGSASSYCSVLCFLTWDFVISTLFKQTWPLLLVWTDTWSINALFQRPELILNHHHYQWSDTAVCEIMKVNVPWNAQPPHPDWCLLSYFKAPAIWGGTQEFRKCNVVT